MNNTNIKFIKKNDWLNHQICGDFPEVDVRCLVFCCSPLKPCPARNAILKEMGLTVEDYAKIKEKSGEDFNNKTNS
ncbi:hypothetical protein ACFLZ0_01010 [Patescibacteria group bacterium]